MRKPPEWGPSDYIPGRDSARQEKIMFLSYLRMRTWRLKLLQGRGDQGEFVFRS